VALGALDALVRPIENPARPTVLESLDAVPGPGNEREILARVVGVTGRTTGGPFAGVEAALLLEQPADFAVTGQAGPVHRFPAGDLVALQALRSALERLMGLRQLPG
jgi:hypothetical protein